MTDPLEGTLLEERTYTRTQTAVLDADGKTLKAGPDVVDYDGIKLRIIDYCDQNGIAYKLLQDDKEVDPKTFKTEKGDWDQVKLITAFNDDNKPLSVKPSVLIPGDKFAVLRQKIRYRTVRTCWAGSV